jgi:hypothetical protein
MYHDNQNKDKRQIRLKRQLRHALFFAYSIIVGNGNHHVQPNVWTLNGEW